MTMPDSEFLRRLTDALAERDLMPSSRGRVVMDLRAYEEWHIGSGGEPLDPTDPAITSVDLAEHRTYLLRTCKPSTVSRHLCSIRTALKLLAPQVLVGLRMPRVSVPVTPAPSGLSRTERLAILRGASKLSARDNLVVMLAMMTGARASSICNLKLDGVKIGPRSGSVAFDVAKGGKPYSIPANAELRAALAAWLRERPPVDHPYLLTSERHPFAPITRWTIHDVWHRRLAKHLPQELAGKLRGSHQARHALGRLLAEQGVPLPDIGRILNHAPGSIGVTARYLQPSEEDIRRHLDRVIGDDDPR